MKILLDTHVLLWSMQALDTVREDARQAICSNNNIVFASISSLWEISIKSSLGKLTLPPNFFTSFSSHGYELLPITLDHIQTLRRLPHHHRDPFDRMLVAQAQWEQLLLVTRDEEIKKYEVGLLPA